MRQCERTSLLTGGADAGPYGRPRPTVVNEDVRPSIGIALDEARGGRPERHKASVRGDCRLHAVAEDLTTVGVDAHPVGVTRIAVVDEHVRAPIAVRANDVGGRRNKRDVPTRPGDRHSPAAYFQLATSTIEVDTACRPPAHVAHKDVVLPIGVASDKIGSEAAECHAATVRRKAGVALNITL